MCTAAVLTCASSIQSASLFVTVAEALTATHSKQKMQVHQRMFTVPIRVKACKGDRIVTKLVGPITLVNLKIGEEFALDSLAVVAIDRLGGVVPLVPTHIDVETKSPPLFDWDPEKIRDGFIQPLREGDFVFRVRTICSQYPTIAIEIPASVH